MSDKVVNLKEVRKEKKFQKKIRDALAKGDIPIFWGSKVVISHFDEDGKIVTDVDDIEFE